LAEIAMNISFDSFSTQGSYGLSCKN